MIKRILSVILASAMLATSLFAAPDLKNEHEPEMTKIEYAYKSTEVILPDNLRVIDIFDVKGNLIAYCENLNSPSKTLVEINRHGEIIYKLPVTLFDSNAKIIDFGFFSDGSLLSLTKYYNYKNNETVFALAKYKDGVFSVIQTNLCSLFRENETDDIMFYKMNFAVDSDDNVYFINDSIILALDKNMNFLFKMNLKGYIKSIQTDSDGRVYICFTDYVNGYSNRYIDPNPVSIEKRKYIIVPNEMFNSDYLYGDGYDLYIKDKSGIYGSNNDPKTGKPGEPVKLLDWNNSDIDESTVKKVSVINEDLFFIQIGYNYDYSTYVNVPGIYMLERIPENELKERYVINLAMTSNFYIENIIMEFNRSNDKYRINLDDEKGKYVNDLLRTDAYTLTKQIENIEMPDMIVCSDFSPYINEWKMNELFTDIYKLIDEDEDIDRTDFFKSVVEPNETDGKLFKLPCFFTVHTIFAKESNVGAESWTPSEYIDFAKSLPFRKHMNIYYSYKTILNTLLTCSLDSFIDYDSKTCSFDDGRFKKILEYAMSIKEEFSYTSNISDEELEIYKRNISTPYRENKLMLSGANVYSIVNYLEEQIRFGGEEAVSIGFPSESGNGAYIETTMSIAICESSELKEGAWEFVKFLLNNNSDKYSGFSSLVSTFDEAASAALEKSYFINYSGGHAESGIDDKEDFKSYYSSYTNGMLHDVTDKDINGLKALINNATTLTKRDNTIITKIVSIARMCYEGSLTINQAVANIQSQIESYVKENS